MSGIPDAPPGPPPAPPMPPPRPWPAAKPRATPAQSHAGKIALTITKVIVNKVGTIRVLRDSSFAVMLNPSEFSHKREICYNTKKTLGQIGADTRFAAINPDTVTFSIILDGTGVAPPPPGESRQEVEQQVKKLNDVVYKYDGDKHEPSHVRLLWGTLILYGRLSSMGFKYTLFKPSGDPLRATVDMTFLGFMSSKEAELRGRLSSPDLTHLVMVREGDTLPLLCDRIYGDPSYYTAVARFNGLTDIRRLKAGDQLRFPPLA